MEKPSPSQEPSEATATRSDGEAEPKNRHEVTASEAKLIGPQPQRVQEPRRPASFFLREEIGRFVA